MITLPLLASVTATLAPSSRVRAAAAAAATSFSAPAPAQLRTASSRPFRPQTASRTGPSASTSASTSESTPPPERKAAPRDLRDEDLARRSSHVRLVDPKSGSLAGPFRTLDILARLDRTRYRLQQVVAAQKDAGPTDPDAPLSEQNQYPICKLIDKKEEFDKQRALKKAKAASAESVAASAIGSVSKEVQLTWSVSPNDLSHKLSKARKELVRGARINVVVTTKAGGKKYIKGFIPEEDERRLQLLRNIESYLCLDEQTQEPVGKRLKDVEWQRGGSAAVVSFELIRARK